jgi:hypothetical protein
LRRSSSRGPAGRRPAEGQRARRRCGRAAAAVARVRGAMDLLLCARAREKWSGAVSKEQGLQQEPGADECAEAGAPVSPLRPADDLLEVMEAAALHTEGERWCHHCAGALRSQPEDERQPKVAKVGSAFFCFCSDACWEKWLPEFCAPRGRSASEDDAASRSPPSTPLPRKSSRRRHSSADKSNKSKKPDSRRGKPMRAFSTLPEL